MTEQITHISYEDLIDEWVRATTGGSDTSNLSRTRQKQLKQFAPDQQKFIEQMLIEERVSAVHDVAAVMEYLTSMGLIKITSAGRDIGSDPVASWHFDFVARTEGDDWPE